MILIGVDVGGTFTDLVVTNTESGDSQIHKIPTTPEDPSQGVIDGLREVCDQFDINPADVRHILHGTTIATNAVLEYEGAKTGLITTAGYRDILHIGRHQRPQHYSIMQDIPWQNRPLVRRAQRLTVTERLIPPNGDVLIPLDEPAVRAAAQQLKRDGVEAIAVCFLFSYLNPAHEDRAREIIQSEYPNCFVTTSQSVSPQFREFERFTTAAMNAFIGPKVRTYVHELESTLAKQGFKQAELHVMGSNGGVATAKMVAEKPVITLLSGPAAGVMGGGLSGQLVERSNLITFDVGGTSADIGLIVKNTYSEATARDTWIGGYPVMAPMIDIHTIGAGGGSIAYIDDGGAFRVGPASAGATPGPAAYGHGGNRPTVTDAHLVLGRLIEGKFLGGEMNLDLQAANTVIDRLASELSLDRPEAADGIMAIINANMANAIRSRTIQKGHDPREFSLVSFGGAGPLHGVDVARILDIPEVIIPPYPGITSAVGLLTTDLKYDAIRTEFQISDHVDTHRLARDFDRMQAELAIQFEQDGLQQSEITYRRSGDLRYVGQGYELRVPFTASGVDAASLNDVFETFQSIHLAEYGHIFDDSPIEIVNIRLTGSGEMPKIELRSAIASTDSPPLDHRPCFFRVEGTLQQLDTALYQRETLASKQQIDGPAIILQKDTTIVIPPGASAMTHPSNNLLIDTGV
ncbi:MAG: hydantoinase/oxoprolinase family protein [Arenicellales bacterium]|nr:hydantoinase/oxoprolinase family protein [Arenicellales bacterium]